MANKWDVIVVGAGHAGIEAVNAICLMGHSALLLTMSIENIGQMSCNPAIGGIGKGHLVKEIDALGGVMGYLADLTAIQYRILNTKKGIAVQATRCQSDMNLYKLEARKYLESIKNLEIKQREVTSLIWKEEKVVGVKTSLGEELNSQIVILTTGTFLNGLIHIGNYQYSAGRAWEFPATKLSKDLIEHGFKIGRLKTGTTPRLDKKTINFKKLLPQQSDNPKPKFSFWGDYNNLPQQNCYITYTNKSTSKILAENLNKSAIYNGNINSVGPRYCPSIEDKIVRFKDKQRHQIFLEPTGLNSNEYYPNGLSTSMPLDVQTNFLRTIEGLENVEIIRPGYAIEYDYIYPEQLNNILETKIAKNLFLAGQINGTTGYEEAAAQGIVVGINAALKIQKKSPLVLLRNEAYIGVLVDDLITKSTEEPYRMFTSRAEYRLLLREDNADQRLSKKSFKLGFLSEDKYNMFLEKMDKIIELKDYINKKVISIENNNTKNKIKESFAKTLKRPEVSFSDLSDQKSINYLKKFNILEKNSVLADIKYEGYIKRQDVQIKRYIKDATTKIPNMIKYDQIPGLSLEVVEKLSKHKPITISQAQKISGITPAALTILIVYLKNKYYQKNI